ncbi:hypothetical protein HDU97_002055 [Phlyctochytrium planicorne]|nr:hypothetical protein HDU97_002055 [Phlyctochytrium planicorne]
MDDEIRIFVSKYIKDVLCDDEKRESILRSITDEGKPFVEDEFMAVTMIDISGYSSLTSYLSLTLGKVASEALSDAISEIVLSNGGDIVKV